MQLQDKLIAKYGCRWNKTGILVNYQQFAKIPASMTCQQTKDKISKGTRNLIKTKEHRKALSEANKGKESALRGRIKITNEKIEKYILEKDGIPNGWRKGAKKDNRARIQSTLNLKKWHKNKKMYITNGIADKFVVKGTEIPDGWKLGRTNGKCYSKLKETNLQRL